MRSCLLAPLLFVALLACPLAVAQPVGGELVASGLDRPLGLTVDAQGLIWATEPGTANDDSRVVVIAADPRDGALTVLRYANVEGGGFVSGTGHAYRLDDDQVLVSEFVFPSAMAYDADGDLYVATQGGDVYRVTSFASDTESEVASAHTALRDVYPNPADGAAAVGFVLGEVGPGNPLETGGVSQAGRVTLLQ